METPYAMGWNQPSMGKQQVATIASDLLFGENKIDRFLSNARERPALIMLTEGGHF
jgi:hypothetical protein